MCIANLNCAASVPRRMGAAFVLAMATPGSQGLAGAAEELRGSLSRATHARGCDCSSPGGSFRQAALEHRCFHLHHLACIASSPLRCVFEHLKKWMMVEKALLVDFFFPSVCLSIEKNLCMKRKYSRVFN